ncbi:MAG: hypothetical protein EOO89_25160 [Pedobacter sp.]|nr:MAG: hypothetical protein EOO89_25160 [Pedobacter sp.]
MKHYEVTRNKAKKLMLRLMFTGTVWGWKIDEKVNKKQDFPYLENFTRESMCIAQGIRPDNANMYETCCDSKRKKTKKSAPAAKQQLVSKERADNETILNEIFGDDTHGGSYSSPLWEHELLSSNGHGAIGQGR